MLSGRSGVAAKSAARGTDEGFHYTRGRFAAAIEKEGLRPGSYVTSRGDLSPLQAQLDLALPPNRGLSDVVIRVDLAGLRTAGYDNDGNGSVPARRLQPVSPAGTGRSGDDLLCEGVGELQISRRHRSALVIADRGIAIVGG
jgi:hypothetical protein